MGRETRQSCQGAKEPIDKSHWNRSVNKYKRMKGESYLGFTRNKQKEWKNDTEREARAMGPRCSGKHVKIYQCNKITDETRKVIFSNFWDKLSWDQKKIYVVNHVQKSVPKRRRIENEDLYHPKSATFVYFLKNGESNLRVCKQMFLNTLALKEWSVRTWCHKSVSGIIPSNEMRMQQNAIERVKKRIQRENEAKRDFLASWLDNLPKLSSDSAKYHSKKLYINIPSIKSKSRLYKRYKEDCKPSMLLDSITFEEIFKKKKLAIFHMSLKKFKHLLEIAAVIDPDYANVYTNLIHSKKMKKSEINS